MLAAKLLGGVGEEKLYVDDVFSAYTRTGTGASQVTTTNIDMTQGYMLWSKGRSGVTDHAIYDSARGVTKDLVSNSTAAETTQAQGLTAVSATGHTMGTLAKVNTSTSTYVDWVFRKAPKFFDVVAYTGNGGTQNIAHSLGVAPGLILVKRTDNTSEWCVYHRSQTKTDVAYLNQTNAFTGGGVNCWGNNSTTVEPTASVFTVGSLTSLNANATPYVAYLFAHDTSTDGIVQCGSVAEPPSGFVDVNLGWEPQYVLIKTVGPVTGDWLINDVSRGMTDSQINYLIANTSAAENPYGAGKLVPTATGFRLYAGYAYGGQNAVYLAIRRSNKPPTLGTQVYNAIARTGNATLTNATGVGFAPDVVIPAPRNVANGIYWFDRLRGATNYLTSYLTNAEGSAASSITVFGMDGFTADTGAIANQNGTTYANWCFKRAPGVFDEVCYTGTGVAKTEAHNLGVAPELIIVKARNSAYNWPVNIGTTTGYLELNTTQQSGTAASYWNSTTPTSSVFSLGNSSVTNGSAVTYVAYLWATKPGITKVFSFTGDGTIGKVINCGFTTGARFILIKRTDAAGDWFVYDTARGYPAGNDGHLSLNTTAAEVITTDDVDYEATGFIVNQNVTTNLNVTSATYIGLAYA